MSPQPNTSEPAHIGMLQMLCGQWAANIVSGLAKLGIPDMLETGPKSPQEIATAQGWNADALYRLMRASASLGVLSEQADGKFAQTALSEPLRTNAKPSLRQFAIFMTKEWHVRGWSRLDHSIKTGKPSMDEVHGMPIFEYLSQNREDAENFNGAMTALSSFEADAVAQAYDFSGFQSITDVAGGHGLLLATILGGNPKLSGTLYEAPQVIEGARKGPLLPMNGRCRYESGNMFQSVPHGTDAYIMKYIIHDWPDDLCLKILKSCRAGVNSGGKLLIVDNVVPTGNEFAFGKIIDIEMLLFPGGKERTEAQFHELLGAAGWKLTRVIPTSAPLSIIEATPA